MKTLLLASLLTVSNVFATDAVTQTYYQMVESLFAEAYVPLPATISGKAWTGRCFNVREPNSPIAAGFIIRTKDVDAGPLGAESKLYELASYSSNEEASYYDKKGMIEVLETNPTFTDLQETALGLQSTLSENFVSTIRQTPKYVVEALMNTENPDAPKVTGYCYYFSTNSLQ